MLIQSRCIPSRLLTEDLAPLASVHCPLTLIKMESVKLVLVFNDSWPVATSIQRCGQNQLRGIPAQHQGIQEELHLTRSSQNKLLGHSTSSGHVTLKGQWAGLINKWAQLEKVLTHDEKITSTYPRRSITSPSTSNIWYGPEASPTRFRIQDWSCVVNSLVDGHQLLW